ncbi:hypothetical protein [Kangiella koreensis]|uniref:HEPN domain-containing protein n=1 Tax=Kangiella koreensis (strain DSM 16069 / JCM 12317 / KCTC 12182 / SW-125) TaxID=523791 RepID=C7RAB2_KANKD|nr:hypothetical protein [Kangiella koreensis]ACV26231.1 conserved hypothetical protein [Kangiella koreensis DSM 16069]
MNNLEFVYHANPHSWFLVADDLHSQAEKLMNSFGNGSLTRRDNRTGKTESWDNTSRSAFLLASFALENVLKAFLIYENPGWISNGNLSKKLRTHDLTALAEHSKFLPYKEKSLKILREFNEGNESWARYPCGLNKDKTVAPSKMTTKLWSRYLWLIGAFAKRLVKLLRKYWKGPHGFHGKYEIGGCFMGVDFNNVA